MAELQAQTMVSASHSRKTSEKDQWSEGACAWPVQSDMAMLLNAEVFYLFTQLLLRYVKPHTKYSGD